MKLYAELMRISCDEIGKGPSVLAAARAFVKTVENYS